MLIAGCVGVFCVLGFGVYDFVIDVLAVGFEVGWVGGLVVRRCVFVLFWVLVWVIGRGLFGWLWLGVVLSLWMFVFRLWEFYDGLVFGGCDLMFVARYVVCLAGSSGSGFDVF